MAAERPDEAKLKVEPSEMFQAVLANPVAPLATKVPPPFK